MTRANPIEVVEYRSCSGILRKCVIQVNPAAPIIVLIRPAPALSRAEDAEPPDIVRQRPEASPLLPALWRGNNVRWHRQVASARPHKTGCLLPAAYFAS